MFISPAYAQGAGGGGGGIEAFLPLILIFVVFYFLLIRPQQKKVKLHKEMLGAIRRGDKIVTGGGIIGTVTKVIDDHEVNVEIAEGIKVRVQRGLISAVLTKPEPVKDDGKSGGSGESGETPPKPAGIGGALKGLLGGNKN
ncbi:MAG: preprotein translocase subunit YajC [Rhodospirillales bacterium]|nr:preprotein translocase subunit YajC [Rhodospirillales bacterium]